MIYFYISIGLFCGGVYLVLSRRNAIGMLLGVELVLNAATLNFVGFNRLYPERIDGQMIALFIIIFAAAEAAVALALILGLYRRYQSADIAERKELKG